MDSVLRYAGSVGLSVRPRTVLVEGTTDEDLFAHAANAHARQTGERLLDDRFGIVAAGVADNGGVSGVVKELISLRAHAKTSLLENGKPKYRFMALFDNDRAGRDAIKTARALDKSILEFKDVFRLHPER